jgi:TP901-1 family phage major tail protein
MSGLGAGINFVLQIESSGSPGTFTTIGGLRSKSLSIKAGGIDITNHGSNQFKEILDGAGSREMTVSGDGVFTDSATEAQLRTDALAQTLRKFRLLDVSNADYWEGTFKITSFQLAGAYDKERTWNISLESSGAFTYTLA